MKLVLSILLVLSSAAFGETVHIAQDGVMVDVSLEPTTFTVGDSVNLRIEAFAAEGVQLTLPHDDAFGPFIVTDESTLLDVPSEEGRQWVWSMQLDTFDASVSTLQDITVDWTDSAGHSGSIAIHPIPVHVSSVAGDALQEMELRDIKGSLPLFSTLGWWPLILIAIIVLVAIVWSIRFFYLPKKCVLSPHEKAMQAIQELRESHVDVQTFYTSLSNIVRIYIEDRFHISTHDKTTREFLIAEKENPRLEHSDRQALANFLVAADLVKFARFEPKANTWDEAIQCAEQFVSNTTPSTEQQLAEEAA